MKQQQSLGARLASIEGHVTAIRRMVDEDVYCIDVLRQTYAVERALKRFEAELGPTERARIAAVIAAKLRPYTVEDQALNDIDLIHAIARSLRATAETRR